MSTLSTGRPAATIDGSRILVAGAVTIVGSVVANLLLLLTLTPLLGLSSSFVPFGAGPIAFFTAFYTVLAVVLFWLLVRFTRRPARIFTILAVVGFVVTAIPNFALAANPAGAAFPGAASDFLTLLLFHIPPFVIALWALPNLSRARS